MTIDNPEIEVLLPVHNEAESIEATIREIYEELSPKARVQFIICEDGSRDDTQEVLRRISASIPAKLLMSSERKGYSRAVRDGMRALEADYLLCLDSDGQCDPKDFGNLWILRDQCDVVLGWRVDRADNWLRRTMSGTFYGLYQALYRTPVHDPSCPYVLIPRAVVNTLVNELGEMQQGFWWEFVARVHRRGFLIKEVPIRHRRRAAGETQVYKLSKLPGIGFHHVVALGRIWWQTKAGADREKPGRHP